MTRKIASEEIKDRIIEIQQGSIKNLIHIDKFKTNRIDFDVWHQWKYVASLFSRYFIFNLGNFLYLISFILIMIFEDKETSLMPVILPFFFFPLFLFQKWFEDSQRTKHLSSDSLIKIKKIYFYPQVHYEDCEWGDLVVGDIILLKQNETFPADILILDSENLNCLLNTTLLDGISRLSKKNPTKLTRVYKYSPLKGNLEEYKKILTGKIQYDPPSGDLLRFKGTLKLKKDPISEELTIDNVALKGSILAFSDWVIGLVIYVGTDVKASYKRLPNYLFHQGNLYDKLLNGLNLMAFIMIIINCIICFIRILSNNDLFHQIFKDNVMEILFVNFTIMIPSNIAILIQCISLFHKYIIEKKYKGNLTLVDPNKFGYLNQITHLIIDKNCALESSRSSIYSIYLPEKKNFFLNSKIKQSNNMYSFPKMPLQEKPPLIKTIKCTKATSKIDLLKCDSIQSNLSEERNIYPFPKPLVYKFSAVIEELNSFNYNKESNLQLNKESGFKNYKNLKEGESPFFKDFNAYDNANLAKFGDLTDILEIGRKIPDNYEDVFKALLLCHEISTKEDVVEKNNCSYLNQFAMPDSETILDFTKQYHHKLLYQCSILNNSMKCYNTLINDQSAQYYILGIQNHNHNIGKYDKYYKFSILLKPAISLLNNKLSQGSFENSTLYFRTDDPSYIDLLDLEELEKDIIKQKMDILKARGLRFVIFSQKKNIEEDEINEYIHHIKKNVEFSSGSLKIENNNELIAILAIKDKPAPGLKSLINDFLTIENKVWLLSNDSEDIVISTAFLLGIIDKQHELLRLEIPLDSCNCNEGWIKIRSILNKLRKSLLGIDEININKNKTTSLRKSVREKSAGLKIFLTGKPIYCLIINGKTFELLCKDQNFLNHFVFIAYFCHSLIGYGMKPKDKEFLLTLIKTKFPNNPITMVIGDGYDDLSMMKQADLSIEIKNKNSKENTGKLKEKDTIPIKVGIVGGDIYTNSFIILRDLIRVQSFSFNHKMINIIFYCYSASFIYILPSTFYTLFFGNLVCPIINPNLFFTKDILILNAISFIYFFWGRKKSENILKIFQWTYKDGKNEMKNFYKFAFWKIFGISIFESIIIIIFIIYGQNFVKLGNVLLWEEFSTFLFSTIFFIICSKMINYFKYKVAISILITILSLIIYFISGLIPFSSNSFQSNSLNNIYDISRNLDLLLLILFLIICNLIHSYFNAKFFSNKFFLDIYGKIKKYLKDGMNVSSLKMRSFSNENEGKFVLKNIGDVISHIFKDTNMDSILQDMVESHDIKANEKGYHSLTLNFKDHNLKKYYSIQTKKFLISRKNIIGRLSMIQYLILISGLLVITYHQNKRDHEIITLICTAYASILLIHRIILNLDYLDFLNKITNFSLPLSNTIFLLFCLIYSQDDNFNSFVAFYALVISILFQSEYIDTFIGYLCISLILFTIFLMNILWKSHGFMIIPAIPYHEESDVPQKISIIIEGVALIVYEVYCKYNKEQAFRNIFLNEQGIKQENKKIGELLSILVPSFVKESLIQGVQTLSEDQGNVTLIFCDLCNFDKIIEQENCGVINLLDKLYRIFDMFCVENDIQKIETVGKTYMACAGLKAVESTLQTIKFKNSTQRIINLALDMMNFTKKFSFGNSKKIIIKIGIHFGPVIAGVIGYHKPQFSLIGDTVNTTSRVCSTGEESTINISQVAYQRIKNIFNNLNFIEKVVEAKGKGQIITYQIIKKNNLAITNRKSRYLIKIDEEEKVSAIKIFTQENQEFLNVSKKIRKNIKNNTILTINNMISQSPRHTASNISNPINFSHSIYANSFRKNSPFENNNSDSLKSLSNIVNEAPLLLKNKIKTDASFHKMNSDLKGNLIDELSYSDKKVSSAYNLSQNDMNFFQYIETEHLKALQKGIQLNIDKIEKTEHFPGEFLSQKKIDVTIKEENKPSQININEDEFFDKLKINENSLEILNFNKFWLSKKNNDPMILEDFLENRKHASFKENVINIFTFSLVYLSNTFLMILKKDYLANFEILLTFRLIISILVFIFFLLFRKKSSHIVFMRRILLILNFLIINELFLEFVLGNYYGIENTLELTLFYLIFINYSYLTFVDNFILLIYIALLLLLQLINNFNLEFILNMILVFFSLILILNNLRMKILSAYQNFNTLRVNKIKKNQQNDLIFNLLPSHILEKFLRNPNQKLNLTDEFEDVTILFADIAGFTKYSSSVSAIQVVALLKDLFTEFDKLCLDNCVYKLYTIGDCYVVLGLIDAEDRNVEGEALNVINFGFQMLEKIKEVKKRVSFHDIDMRIGIHTGKIIGGIIGTDIVRYDVYGKDVVIANKMESNGIEGRITVSETTKKLLQKVFPDSFGYEFHKEIHLPSFNELVQMFQIFEKRKED